MSLLGFDALGSGALGQLPISDSTVLVASPGSYAVAGQAALFRGLMPSAAGSYAVTGSGSAFLGRMPAATGAYVVSGNDAALILTTSLMAEAGSYIVTGIDVQFSRDFEAWIQRPFETDTWTAQQEEQEAWTPAIVQFESWTGKVPQIGVFDPLVFTSDAFVTHGTFWVDTTKQTEIWTKH